MNDDPPIPESHPIRDIWEINRKIGLLEGQIELARAGDAQSAKDLLALFVYRMHSSPPPPQALMNYVRDCFASIIKGEDANIALHLTNGKKGRSTLTASEKQYQCWIGWSISDLMRVDQLNLEEACEIICERENISFSKAKKAYIKYMVVPSQRSRSKK